jgi:hypothetical protein
MASFTASFVTNFAGGVFENADDVLIAGINAGFAYFNIHSSAFPGGEIRGFLRVQQIPEPATVALLAIALAGLAFARRQKQQ